MPERAGANTEMVRNLIKYGTDINLGDTSALFTAFASHDLPTVETIVDSRAGLNARRKANNPHEFERLPVSEIPPLHCAASCPNNTKTRRGSALPIVRLFLEKGADPYEIINGQVMVMHDIFANGGSVEPLFELPSLDLEHRDPLGRTLLLTGC